MTKKQRSARASKQAKQRAIVKAVRAVLKKTNPSAKITGASVVKLKGGVLKITPIRQNPKWTGGYRITFAGWSNPRRVPLQGYNAFDYLTGNQHEVFVTRRDAQSWLRRHHRGKDKYGVSAKFKVVHV